MIKKTSIISLTFGIIISFLIFSPIFYLNKITISPAPVFVDINACQSSLDTLVGKHIFEIFFFNLIEKQLSSFLEIESFDNHISWFNHFHISFNERSPWISSIIDGNSVFIDKQGYILTYNESHSPPINPSIFIVKGLFNDTFSGSLIDPDRLRSLHTYVELFESFLPKSALLLERVHNKFWQLVIDDHIVVLLGDLSNLPSKFERINFFLDTLDPDAYRNLDYIDSRIDNKLLVTYANK